MGEIIKLRDSSLSWREIEGDIVVLDGQESVYLGLNRTGAELWKLLAAGASREQLQAALVERFGADAPTAERDVGTFLAEMRRHQLLAA